MAAKSPKYRANPAEYRAGWTLEEHSNACSYSRGLYYVLPEHLRPRSIKLGKRRIIIESPADYLTRLASA